MTIVDEAHAAELVTFKGKVYKFDAIECMVNYERRNPNEYKFRLAMDYLNPGNFLEVEMATFLISENIPSPMGAYLSAFSSMDLAKEKVTLEEDLLLNYQQLSDRLKNRNLPNQEAYSEE